MNRILTILAVALLVSACSPASISWRDAPHESRAGEGIEAPAGEGVLVTRPVLPPISGGEPIGGSEGECVERTLPEESAIVGITQCEGQGAVLERRRP